LDVLYRFIRFLYYAHHLPQIMGQYALSNPYLSTPVSCFTNFTRMWLASSFSGRTN